MYQRRNSLRLKEFDYKKEGAYFVTITCLNRKPLFKEVMLKHILEENIKRLENRFSLTVEVYVVMPDHLHLIITLPEKSFYSLSKIVQTLKSLVYHEFRIRSKNNLRIWQRGFYDHIIRNQNDFLEKMNYILNNPLALQIKKRAKVNFAPTRVKKGFHSHL